jgi:PAS domain S-box-containing protein
MQFPGLSKNSSIGSDETGTIRKNRFIRDKLLLKINIPVAAVLLVGISIWSYFHIDFQDKMQTNNIITNADLMSKTIRFNLDYSMMLNSREDIKNILADYGALSEIRTIRVLNKVGDVKFASEAERVGASVHLSDPLCQVCHSQPEPMVLPTLRQRLYQELDEGGEHVLRLVTPIPSESRCAAAACHYHRSDEKVLGMLDLSFSLRGKDELVRDIKRNTVILAVSLFVATFITIFILFYVFIKKPIGKIMTDASILAEGLATPNSNADLNDEIGQLSAAVHKMGDDLIQKQTQLMLQKNLYQDLFNNITSAVFVVDNGDLRIIDCNASAVGMYGTTKEELLGRPFSQFFSGGDEAENRELRQAIGAVLTGGSLDQTKHVALDGREFFVSLQATPMEFNDREVLLVSTVDITARLKAEQQLIQASKMATLGEMATAVAHELNQPLAVIQTSIDLVSRKIQRHENPTGTELERITGLMATSIERAINIINHMREFGRKSDMHLEPVSVNEILRRAFEFFGQQLSLRNIAVEWRLDEHLPRINGLANRLEQVIVNLFTNARDAIEERAARDEGAAEKRITIRSFLDIDEVAVEFSDTGVGIPARYRDKIFEPFFTTKEVSKGTGLGLSISYGIVKEHGGSIDVTDNESGGATFHIRLPVAYD